MSKEFGNGPLGVYNEKLITKMVVQEIAEMETDPEVWDKLPFPAIGRKEAVRLAPELGLIFYEAVNQTMVSDKLHHQIMGELEDLAREAAKRLPREKRRAIARAAVEKAEAFPE